MGQFASRPELPVASYALVSDSAEEDPAHRLESLQDRKVERRKFLEESVELSMESDIRIMMNDPQYFATLMEEVELELMQVDTQLFNNDLDEIKPATQVLAGEPAASNPYNSSGFLPEVASLDAGLAVDKTPTALLYHTKSTTSDTIVDSGYGSGDKSAKSVTGVDVEVMQALEVRGPAG